MDGTEEKPDRVATLETTLISKRKCYVRDSDRAGDLGEWDKSELNWGHPTLAQI